MCRQRTAVLILQLWQDWQVCEIDEIVPYILFEKHVNIFALETREPALCQLYRHTFVPCFPGTPTVDVVESSR